MRLRYVLASVLLLLPATLVPTTALGQSAKTDSEVLQALLVEVRQLRYDLATAVVAVQQGDILVYRLQVQQAVVVAASRRLDEARAKLSDAESARLRLSNDIKQDEDLANGDNTAASAKKQIQDALPQLRTQLSQLEGQEAEARTKAVEAEDLVRTERARLVDLNARLDKIDAMLERSSQQTRSSGQ